MSLNADLFYIRDGICYNNKGWVYHNKGWVYRASDYIASKHSIACSVLLNSVAVYNLLFSVSCQSALSVVCMRLILTLVIKA